MTLPEYRKKVDGLLAAREASRVRLRAARDEHAAIVANEAAVREAVGIAQGIAQAVQEQAHRRIADVVSRSLEAVLDEPYQFKIVFEQKRGRTEACLVFTRDGEDVDPVTASGGGVVDLAALALRLSCLLLARPPLRRLIVLDEPLKHLSREYTARARELLLTLSRELGVQFIIVTHSPALACGKVIEL